MFGIIVLHFLLIDHGKLSKFKIAGFIPYAVLALIFMVIAIGGKARIVVSVSFWDQILVAGKSTTFYIYKFIFPTDLTIIYPLQGDISLFSEEIFPFALFSVILVLAAIYSWRKYPWFSFAVGWYIITLSPTYLNIGKAGLVFFAVDRYAYLPSVGLLFLFIVMAGAVFKNINIFQYSHPYFKKVLVIFIGISIIAGCVWLSRKQTHVWDSPEALYLKSLSVYPESVGARVGLSTIYRRQNKLTDSFEVLREGLKYGDYSLLHLHAGYIYAKNGQINEALERFKIASEKDTKNPEPIFAIGSLYEQINDIENAILFYNKAIALDGSYVVVRSKLGMLYLNKNKMQEAYEQFKAALKWNRNSYEANFGMAKLLEKEGKTSEAQTYIRKAELAEKYGLTP
jgi:tetratricopeptide (TPR) repeat protein